MSENMNENESTEAVFRAHAEHVPSLEEATFAAHTGTPESETGAETETGTESETGAETGAESEGSTDGAA